MKTNVGLWIDNKNAVLVFVSDKKIEEIIVKPNHDKINGSLTGVMDEGKANNNEYSVNNRDPKKHNHFYYDVMRAIRKAESIFIMGNGESEVLLLDELIRNNLSCRITVIETTGKLVITRLAYKVQNYFLKQKTLMKCA